MRRLVLSIGALATAIALLLLWTGGLSIDSGGAIGGATAPPDRDVAGAAPEPETKGPIVEALRALPRGAELSAAIPSALRDTDIDGGLSLGADGQLLVTRDVRRFFDYFLLATGDESPGALRQRILDAIHGRLPAAPAATAIALLDRYLLYRQRTRELAAAGEFPEALSERFERLRALRQELLGAEVAAAFFGDEEADIFVAVAQQHAADDPGLSPQARRDAAEALAEQLPDDSRAARAAATAPLRLAREEAALRAAGGGADEIRTLREGYFGVEAADRLQALDVRREQWQQRLDSFRAAKAALIANASLSEAERSRAIDALIAERFTESEQIRVAALERLSAEP